MEEKKGKEKKIKKTSKSTLYQTEKETLSRKRKSCPKCGPGVFMAEHPNRQSCGNCGFTEWKNA